MKKYDRFIKVEQTRDNCGIKVKVTRYPDPSKRGMPRIYWPSSQLQPMLSKILQPPKVAVEVDGGAITVCGYWPKGKK